MRKRKRKRINRNFDVASYYPHLMTICGYTSRNIPSPDVFKNVLEQRMKAKAAGDKATANALKLVVNTTYGAMLNQYNDLFDPLMGRSVCITGQLFLLELAQNLYKNVENLRIVQLNTDGVMIEFYEDQYDEVLAIVNEWQQRTGFELEEDSVALIAQKDVNNYVEVQPSGSVKIKGGYLVRGIAPAGAFNINNNACIVATALKEYFVHGTPVEDTINGCDDIFQFQLIAKAGAKYREAYHLVDGEQTPVQKVNRVYATKDERYGKLFKVKAENDATAKIEMLPEHCIIDNDNQLTIDDVDKTFYIEMAKKRINDFLGVKPEKKERKKKMAAAKTAEKPKNVFAKLLEARVKFLAAGVKKSGKNMHLKFTYFELEDIVPVATPIFAELGLLPLVNFTDEAATMTVVNVDEPSEIIQFTSPMRNIEGNAATNAVQALGASETYQRRYLYMAALDITESDTLDGTAGAPAPAPAPKAPPTPEQREAVKKELTNAEGNASDLQIKQLKNALTQLRSKDPSKEEWIAQVAIATQGFTKMTKTDCENILTKVSEMLEAGGA